MKSREVNLSTLHDGAVDVLFREGLGEVLGNIQDPNADPKGKRKIVITLTFKPNESRESCAIDIDCKTKLVPLKPLATTVMLGEGEGGEPAAVEILRQERLPLGEPAKKPLTLTRGAAAPGGE
jgi:hypothetical protein